MGKGGNSNSPNTVVFVEIGGEDIRHFKYVYVDDVFRTRQRISHSRVCHYDTRRGTRRMKHVNRGDGDSGDNPHGARSTLYVESSSEKVGHVLSLACPNNSFILPLIDDDLSDEHKLKLLQLPNEHRDCFAQTTNELGKNQCSRDANNIDG